MPRNQKLEDLYMEGWLDRKKAQLAGLKGGAKAIGSNIGKGLKGIVSGGKTEYLNPKQEAEKAKIDSMINTFKHDMSKLFPDWNLDVQLDQTPEPQTTTGSASTTADGTHQYLSHMSPEPYVQYPAVDEKPHMAPVPEPMSSPEEVGTPKAEDTFATPEDVVEPNLSKELRGNKELSRFEAKQAEEAREKQETEKEAQRIAQLKADDEEQARINKGIPSKVVKNPPNAKEINPQFKPKNEIPKAEVSKTKQYVQNLIKAKKANNQTVTSAQNTAKKAESVVKAAPKEVKKATKETEQAAKKTEKIATKNVAVSKKVQEPKVEKAAQKAEIKAKQASETAKKADDAAKAKKDVAAKKIAKTTATIAKGIPPILKKIEQNLAAVDNKLKKISPPAENTPDSEPKKEYKKPMSAERLKYFQKGSILHQNKESLSFEDAYKALTDVVEL